MTTIKRFHTGQQDFAAQLDRLLAWDSLADPAVEARVDEILQAVRSKGDTALLEYSNQFDGLNLRDVNKLLIPGKRLKQALRRISQEQRDALKAAAKRI